MSKVAVDADGLITNEKFEMSQISSLKTWTRCARGRTQEDSGVVRDSHSLAFPSLSLSLGCLCLCWCWWG